MLFSVIHHKAFNLFYWLFDYYCFMTNSKKVSERFLNKISALEIFRSTQVTSLLRSKKCSMIIISKCLMMMTRILSWLCSMGTSHSRSNMDFQIRCMYLNGSVVWSHLLLFITNAQTLKKKAVHQWTLIWVGVIF